jgi:hypothetical protein
MVLELAVQGQKIAEVRGNLACRVLYGMEKPAQGRLEQV